MFKKIKNIFFLFFFLLFILLILKYYFSNENIVKTNKSRTLYTLNLNENYKKLPTLQNDTKNIINYINDLEDFKKKRKTRVWEKLIFDENK